MLGLGGRAVVGRRRVVVRHLRAESRGRLCRERAAVSKQTPSWPGARPASPHEPWQDVTRSAPTGAPDRRVWHCSRRSAAARECLRVWILHRAHENDAAALPLHSWGCLPRLAGGDGGDAPRRRGRRCWWSSPQSAAAAVTGVGAFLSGSGSSAGRARVLGALLASPPLAAAARPWGGKRIRRRRGASSATS